MSTRLARLVQAAVLRSQIASEESLKETVASLEAASVELQETLEAYTSLSPFLQPSSGGGLNASVESALDRFAEDMGFQFAQEAILEKAKQTGKWLLEKIKKIWAWIMQKVTSVYTYFSTSFSQARKQVEQVEASLKLTHSTEDMAPSARQTPITVDPLHEILFKAAGSSYLSVEVPFVDETLKAVKAAGYGVGAAKVGSLLEGAVNYLAKKSSPARVAEGKHLPRIGVSMDTHKGVFLSRIDLRHYVHSFSTSLDMGDFTSRSGTVPVKKATTLTMESFKELMGKWKGLYESMEGSSRSFNDAFQKANDRVHVELSQLEEQQDHGQLVLELSHFMVKVATYGQQVLTSNREVSRISVQFVKDWAQQYKAAGIAAP